MLLTCLPRTMLHEKGAPVLHGLGIVIDMSMYLLYMQAVPGSDITPPATSSQSLFGDTHSPVGAQRLLSWYLRFVCI